MAEGVCESRLENGLKMAKVCDKLQDGALCGKRVAHKGTIELKCESTAGVRGVGVRTVRLGFPALPGTDTKNSEERADCNLRFVSCAVPREIACM